MARNGITPKVKDFDLSDGDTEALFASPSRPQRPKPSKPGTKGSAAQKSHNIEDREVDDDEGREVALRDELAGIRNINQVIEGAMDSLERTGGNMNTVSHTVNDASVLLNTWTRILSQTEHNQRLILDPSWPGATQDMADIENESVLKQQEQERWELLETQKREARARKAEEERKRPETMGAKTPKGLRGSGRATSRRGGSARTANHGVSTGPAKASGSRVARAGSGIGRGPSSNRGRARGA
ncbi:MAG: hypothetical protein Q9170_000162 [Blastenia crenularia]